MYRTESIIKKNEIIVKILKENRVICQYKFRSRQEGSYTGKKIVYITLLRYALLDCLNIDEIVLDVPLSNFEISYLERELDNMKEYSCCYHGVEIDSPILHVKKTFEHFPAIPLSNDCCYIGFSGGKDSTLCYSLIKNMFDKVIKFKIDFDDEDYINEYHEMYDIRDDKEYELISTKQIYNSNNIEYYQEEDLHCCFAAPFFSVKNMDPAILSVGLQFDVVNYHLYDNNGERLSEYGLTETYESLKTVTTLFRTYGLTDFKMIVPLASLTSFSIYTILNQKFGTEKLRQLNSCWNPKNDEPCGDCVKCQRVAYIYKHIGLSITEQEKNSIAKIYQNKISFEYLFGSMSIKKLLDLDNISGELDLQRSVYFDEKISELDWGIYDDIASTYDLRIKENPLKSYSKTNGGSVS